MLHKIRSTVFAALLMCLFSVSLVAGNDEDIARNITYPLVIISGLPTKKSKFTIGTIPRFAITGGYKGICHMPADLNYSI